MRVSASTKRQSTDRADHVIFSFPPDVQWSQEEIAEFPIKWVPSEAQAGLAIYQRSLELWEEVIGTSLVRAHEAKLRRLEGLFVFRDEEKVMSFIRHHPILADVLEGACVEIEKYFGPYTQVFLDVVIDPEVQGLAEMFGYIVCALMPEEASKRLQQFDRGWFLRQLPQIKGLLNFDVEFL